MPTITQTTAGSYSWVVPTAVTSAVVECWGGGGNGGNRSTSGAAGGGGGGEYAKETVTVTPGNSYPYVVGAGGATGTTANAGGASTFNATTVVANGGGGVAANATTGGAGGTGSADATHFNGGNGWTPTAGAGGGGGGSGGTASAGNNATSATGATAVTGGGAGGAGAASNGNGTNGSAPGGGGGGAARTSGSRTGGAGAAGKIVITYTTPKMELLVDEFTTKDTGKWTYPTGADATGGQFVGTPQAATVDNYTVDSWDFSSSYIIFNVAQMVDAANQALLGMIDPGTNNDAFRFYKWVDDRLYFTELVAGVQNDTSIVWDAVNHKYLRLRESGGTVFFDTSPDGTSSSWTTQRSKTWAVPQVTNLKPFIIIGSNAGGTTALKLDSVNGAIAAGGVSLAPPVRQPNYGGLLQL